VGLAHVLLVMYLSSDPLSKHPNIFLEAQILYMPKLWELFLLVSIFERLTLD